MGVRLRYLAHDLEVPAGQFVIGRSADCQLSLDDSMVSRRHALLVVTGDQATVEDLESRNGVVVNGKKIEGRQALADGDKITIGGQVLTIAFTTDSHPANTQRFEGRMRLATLAGPRATELADAVAAVPTVQNDPHAVGGSSVPLVADPDDEPTTFVTTAFVSDPSRPPDSRVDALVLIGGVAEKALAMGRAEEAERLLLRGMMELLEKAKSGVTIAPVLALRSAEYATKLAGATGRGAWVDYVFELYTALETLLPAPVVDALYEVVRNVKIDRGTLRSYTELLRSRSSKFGPGERFVLQRIEGLERLGALK